MPGNSKGSKPAGSHAGGIYAAVAALRDELLRQIDIKAPEHVTFKVASIAPLTVYLSGGTTAVPASELVGQTYAVDDTGIAIVGYGPPICLKIA